MNNQVTSKTLLDHATEIAEKQPEKAALKNFTKDGVLLEEITYGELLSRLQIAAGWLMSQNVKLGDVIGLAMRNSPDLLIMSWAAWSVGMVTAPLDMKRDTILQHEYKLTLCQASLLVTQNDTFTDEERQAFKIPVAVTDDINWERKSDDINWQEDIDETALILFTSGTTSHPKGAKLSLKNLLVNADAIRSWLQIRETDTFLVNLPLHHINSTTLCLATLLGGGTIAIIPNYSNSQFWLEVARTGATVTSIVQSICFDQLSRRSEFEAVQDDVKLTRMQIGSAPVVTEDLKQFMKEYGVKFYQGYGQTETALRVTGVPMDIPDALYEELVETNSIGTPMPWADLQVLDENGEKLGPDAEGELAVKGPAVMQGYLGDVPAFNKDGYFMTGDIGLYKEIDGQKYVYLKGRKKEIIIKGGINISPVAVENQLKQIAPEIGQVYVVGVPDDRYGEEVGAVICWREGTDETTTLLKLKQTLIMGTELLSSYETPQYFLSYDTKELPMTSTGKIQRSVLRDKITKDQFSPITEVAANDAYHFFVLTPQSLYLSDAYKLYNQCWQPLTISFAVFKTYVANQTIIVAVNPDGALAGSVAFVRTNLSEDALGKTTYNDLIDPKKGKHTSHASSFVCVSICSASYKPRETPLVEKKPTVSEVLAYLESGKDGVYAFHQKPKGGADAGASLLKIIPEGRPADTSALGYTVLLKYPKVSRPMLSENAPVSVQLIEVVMLVSSINGSAVYALSRPGGLASYLAKQS